MLFHSKYKSPQFNYTPRYLKEPEPDLRERLRIPREPDRHSSGRPTWHYLLLLLFFILCYWKLFPQLSGNMISADIVIDVMDEVPAVQQSKETGEK